MDRGAKRFSVTITEILKQVVEVEAEDQRQAKEIVLEGWKNSRFILGPDNFIDVEFEAVPASDRKQSNVQEGEE